MSGNQAQPTQKYDVQPANRGSNPWTDWVRDVRNSRPDNKASSSNSWHASACGAHAWDRNGIHIPQDGVGRINGLLKPVRIWPGQTTILTEICMLAE